jgi:FG-GAP repeat protein
MNAGTQQTGRFSSIRPSLRWMVLFGCFTLVPALSAVTPTSAAAWSRPEVSRARTETRPAAVRVASDFDGDGFADLAVGVPEEDVDGTIDAGAINVVYGSVDGPKASSAQFWSQGSSGVEGRPEQRDRFGSALAPGDFNGDGFADLAIGSPGENVGGIGDAGVVNVLYGSAAGLTSTGNQLWAQSSPGIRDVAEKNDRFGFALAAGDFQRDGYADLAVGTPYEDLPGGKNSGAVNVLYGSPGGVGTRRNQFWNQDSPGIKGAISEGCGLLGPYPELCDRFGWALASANFGNGPSADLAIGVPGELTDFFYYAAGAVNVIYGASGIGLSATRNQLWSQGTPGVKGNPYGCDPGSGCTLEYFGAALVAADFGKGFQAELAIGVPGDFVGSDGDGAGGVNVLYGSSAGLVVDGNQLWTQDSPGVIGDAEGCPMFEENCIPDNFGAALASGNLGNGPRADLAVGVPLESLGTIAAAGGVNVLYGGTTGLTATGNQFWTQDSPDIADAAEENDRFGSALYSASFGQGAQRDLAIGVPGQDVGPAVDAGAVNLLFGSTAGLSASGNQFWHQDGAEVGDAPEASDHFGRSLA